MRRGFTLLEIVIGMALVSVFIGASIMFVSQSKQKHLHTFSSEFQLLSKNTLQKALQEKRPYFLVFHQDAIKQFPEGSDFNTQTPSTTLDIPNEVTLSVLDGDQWHHVKNHDNVFTWGFSQSGLCDPIQLKLESKNYLETLHFNPLTAGIIHEDPE